MTNVPPGGPPFTPSGTSASAAAPQIRPARFWYAIAAGVFVLGIVVAVVLIVRLDFPGPEGEFRSGGTQTVDLDREGLTIFADRSVTGGRCEAADGAGNPIALTEPTGSETVTSNGTEWKVVLRSDQPQPPGRFTVTCEAADATATFAVGPHASVFGALGQIFAAIGTAVVCGLIALVIVLIVAIRRSAASRRLRPAGPYGGGGQAPPGPYGGGQASPGPDGPPGSGQGPR